MSATYADTGFERFVPRNLPNDTELRKKFDAELAKKPENRRTAYATALARAVYSILSCQVMEQKPLEEAIESKSGNCFAFTALVAFIGRTIPDIVVTPVIRTEYTRSDTEGPIKYFHSFPIVRTADTARFVRIDREGYANIPWAYPLSRKHELNDGALVVFTNQSSGNESDLVQVRRQPDGGEITLRNEETSAVHDRTTPGVYITETAFYGQAGLGSFLATYEMQNALKIGEAFENNLGLLIPRL